MIESVQTALHEAAHVVAALEFPGVIEVVEVILDASGRSGRTRIYFRQSPRLAEARGVFYAAGLAGEESTDSDADWAGSEGDDAQLSALLDHLGLVGQARALQVGEWRAEAARILRRRWRLLDALANELHARKRLSGSEVQAIARRVSQ